MHAFMDMCVLVHTHRYIYIYICTIIGYNQVTLHKLKQDDINVEPAAVSAGHAFMVTWLDVSRVAPAKSSDQP